MLDLAQLSWIVNAWTSFSAPAAIASATGAGFLVLAFIGVTWLPGILKRPLIGLGLLLLAGGVTYQIAHIDGAQDAFKVTMENALKAEKARADAAERITREIAAQAEKDQAGIEDANRKLKEIKDAVAKDKDAARVCVDHDLARRLRNL